VGLQSFFEHFHYSIPSKSSARPASSPLEHASFGSQLLSGIKLTGKILIPSWLVLWSGAGIADYQASAHSIDPLSFSRKIPENATRKITWNNTPLTQNLFYLRYQSRINPEKFPLTSDIDDAAIEASAQQELQEYKKGLKQFYPEVSAWVAHLEEEGKFIISKTFNNDTSGLCTYYNPIDGTFTVYEGFFCLNDTRKIAATVHEYVHSLQPTCSNLNEFLNPKTLGMRIIERYCELGVIPYRQLQEWSKKASYDDNRTEQEAYAAEIASLRSFPKNSVNDAYIDSIIENNSLSVGSLSLPLKKIPLPVDQFCCLGCYGIASLILLKRKNANTSLA